MSRAAERWQRRLVIAMPSLWLAIFLLLPFLIVLKISLAGAEWGTPPYTPLVTPTSEDSVQIHINFGNYLLLARDSLYLASFIYSLKVAIISTAFTLLLGYPMAYAIARADGHRKQILLLLVVLPFWTSFLLRVYAWMGILRDNGMLNNLLQWLGIIDEPLRILYTDAALVIGTVYAYLPLMILPIYAVLDGLDETLLDAAADLGARPWAAFLHVTLPLSAPGVLAGCLLVFIPASGEFVVPSLLGGPDSLMAGRVVWDEFFRNRDWPVASAIAVMLLLLLTPPIVLFQLGRAGKAKTT